MYRNGNFSFVVDNTFRPFTMQEILTPLTMYKDAYDKTEEAYTALADKADKFKYLSRTLPEDSEARQIYERYANDLKVQAEDLGKHGLTVSNRRALNSLRNRYQGEIGMLADAQDALTKDREWRRQMSAKDPSMLYGANNLTINDYLYGNTPSQYSVSGDALFTRGAAIGKSLSSREYKEGDGGSTLGGYYRQWITQHGVAPQSIEAFMQSDAVQQEINRQMKATGAEDNLTGIDKDRARYQLESGLYNGIVYEQSIKLVRDEGELTKDQLLDNARADRTQLLYEEKANVRYNSTTKQYERNDPDEWMYTHEDEGNPNVSRRTGLSEKGREYFAARRASSGKTTVTTNKPKLSNFYWQAKDSNVYDKNPNANNKRGQIISFDEVKKLAPELAARYEENSSYYTFYASYNAKGELEGIYGEVTSTPSTTTVPTTGAGGTTDDIEEPLNGDETQV